MTTQFRQNSFHHQKFLNQHLLFKKATKHQKLQIFQLLAKNQSNCGATPKQNEKDSAGTPLSSTDKSNLAFLQVNPEGGRRKNKIIVNDDRLFLNDSKEKTLKKSPKRAFSSNKFDLLTIKQNKRKGKKKLGKIFEYVKLIKKQSNSKKSTDQSSETPIQHLKAQIEHYRQNIKYEQMKMKRLQQQIRQQTKKHKLELHIYNHNIEKLKKLAGVDSIDNLQEDVMKLEIVKDDQDCDCISIQSN